MRIQLIQTVIDKIRGKVKKTANKVEKDLYSYSRSYSQCGEDLIVAFVLKNYCRLGKISYLDIGAHHSSWLSNTKLFYETNGGGVLIEPDPTLFTEIKANRPHDICLNCGVGISDDPSADFYVMNVPTLNTFSKEEAYRNQNENNFKIKEKIKIPLRKLDLIFEEYFPNGLDFMSLDIEGLDLSVLQTIDFSKYRPKVICVETLTFDNDRKKQHKETDILDFLKSKNYFAYADTHINTIFVDKEIW